jgi:hypothetical protein
MRIKANELRIGNLIYWNIPEKVDTIHTVVGIRNDKPQTVPISLGESIENYQPIQLTEEWLLKFGFNKVSDIWEFWKNSGWDLRQHKLENTVVVVLHWSRFRLRKN